MGANGALKLWRILDNVEQVLAIEALTAAQACDLRGTEGMAPALMQLHAHLRKVIPFASADRFLHPYLVAARRWMFSDEGASLRAHLESQMQPLD